MNNTELIKKVNGVENKVDKIEGKQLSTNDFDDRLKQLVEDWNNFKINGGEIGGTDGTKLKINGRAISAIGEALALSGGETSPMYYARNKVHNVDQLIPGGQGELGSDDARWQELYLGNYSKSTNGYTKLPNGFILQWGEGVSIISGEESKVINFPIAFPNNCIGTICFIKEVAGYVPTRVSIASDWNGLSNFRQTLTPIIEGSITVYTRYIAIGY